MATRPHITLVLVAPAALSGGAAELWAIGARHVGNASVVAFADGSLTAWGDALLDAATAALHSGATLVLPSEGVCCFFVEGGPDKAIAVSWFVCCLLLFACCLPAVCLLLGCCLPAVCLLFAAAFIRFPSYSTSSNIHLPHPPTKKTQSPDCTAHHCAAYVHGAMSTVTRQPWPRCCCLARQVLP